MQSVSAIGLKYLELEKGTSPQTLKPGATIPVCADARTGGHRRAVQHVRQEDANGDPAATRTTSATASPGAALGLNETIATLRPLVTDAVPVLHNLASPQTRLRQAVPRARPARLAGRPGGGDAGRLLQRARHLLHGLGGRRAVAGTDDRRAGPRRSRRRRTRCRSRRTVRREQRPSSCACCARARSSLRNRRGAARPRLRRGRGQPARRHRPEHAARGSSPQALAGVRAEPGRDARPRRPHADDANSATPLLAGHRARAGVLQLRDADVPQRRQPAGGERRQRHARARGDRALPRTDPTTRASPRRRPANGPSIEQDSFGKPMSTTTTCTPTPTRTSPAPASRGCAKPATRSYVPGKLVIGNTPPARQHEQPRTDHRANRTCSANAIRTQRRSRPSGSATGKKP